MPSWQSRSAWQSGASTQCWPTPHGRAGAAAIEVGFARIGVDLLVLAGIGGSAITLPSPPTPGAGGGGNSNSGTLQAAAAER